MENKIEYGELFMRLSFEAAIVQFMKKNGELRLMLATRNVDALRNSFGFIGAALGGHDKRCSIKNGNLAVIDMELGDARSFSVDRVLYVEFLGEIDTPEKLDEVYKKFSIAREKFDNEVNKALTMDMLD